MAKMTTVFTKIVPFHDWLVVRYFPLHAICIEKRGTAAQYYLGRSAIARIARKTREKAKNTQTTPEINRGPTRAWNCLAICLHESAREGSGYISGVVHAFFGLG